MAEVFEVIDSGVHTTIQDQGRRGWKRFGVPPSGALDQHAASWANRLLDNPPDAPVVEMLFGGLKLRALADCWIAVTGAAASWRATPAKKSEVITFVPPQFGLWTYLAVDGGFDVPRIFGSASTYRRANLGCFLKPGNILKASRANSIPANVSGRFAQTEERRDYSKPPAFRVWKGPQWDLFSGKARGAFFDGEWKIAAESDRVGYRLTGPRLEGDRLEILSEPVLVGSIQVPESGQPIVTMPDGPTVGGYPKLGLVYENDISWLAQCRPGQTVRFQLLEK
jgi:biotin-dependent carboxylase-like uncharacterized protein